MPTTVVSVIAASGGDYSTLQSWEDDCPADLTATDEIWEGQIRAPWNTASSSPLTFGGTTTDSTRFKRIKAEAGSSFKDHADAATNALRFNTANGVSIESTNFYGATIYNNAEQDVHIEGLQLLGTACALSYGNAALVLCRVKDCIMQAAGTFGGACMSDNGGGAYDNCLIITTSSAKGGFAGTRVHTFTNCTLVNLTGTGSTGITVDFGVLTSVNTAVFGFGTHSNGGTHTNGASDASSPPSGVTTLTYDTTTGSGFENIGSGTEDFRIKSTSGLKDAGNSSGTAVDIIGTSRPQGSAYDIGAWEFIAAGSPWNYYANA